MFRILWWVIVGLIAGWATGKIMKSEKQGALMDIVIGIVGALIGGFIMRFFFNDTATTEIYTILVAIGGAVLLTFVVRKVATA